MSLLMSWLRSGVSVALWLGVCLGGPGAITVGAEGEPGTAAEHVVPIDWSRFRPDGRVAVESRDL